jgi:hypothetical protein
MSRFRDKDVPPVMDFSERLMNFLSQQRYQSLRSRYLGERQDTLPWWVPLVGAALFGFFLGQLLSRRR